MKNQIHVPWKYCAVLAIVVIALYGQTLSFKFTSLDDDHLIVQNYRYISSVKNIPLAFTTDVFWKKSGMYYRPILNLSLIFDTIGGKGRPFAYHLTNVLLHALSVIAVFLLLLMLIQQKPLAFVLSLLFAVHPILTQAVAWIPGRNDILLMLFTIASIGALAKYKDSQRFHWLLAHGMLFLLALFVKETAVVIPFVCTVYLLSAKPKLTTARWISISTIWTAILFGYFIIRQAVLKSSMGGMAANLTSPRDASIGILYYLGKILLPFNQSVWPIAEDLVWRYGLLALGLFILLFIRGVKRPGNFILGCAWFTIFIIPTLVQTPETAGFMEQRMYLPLFGVLLMMAESNLLLSTISRYRTVIICATVALFCFYCFQAFNYSRTFKEEYPFWQNAVRTSPHNYIARWIMGKGYVRMGMNAKAEQELKAAVAINPGYVKAQQELGLFYFSQGRVEESRERFRQVLELQPDHYRARLLLGKSCFSLGAWQEAAQEITKLLQENPHDPELYDLMGLIYLNTNRLPEAEKSFFQALAIQPRAHVVLTHLSYLYSKQNKHKLAEQYNQKAKQLLMESEPKAMNQRENATVLQPYSLPTVR